MKEKRNSIKERFKTNQNEMQESSQKRLQDLHDKFDKADQHRRDYFNKIGERQQYRKEVNRLKETDKNDIQNRFKRQMDAKKMMILMKEKEHEESIMEVRIQEERLRLIKQEMNRRLIQEK